MASQHTIDEVTEKFRQAAMRGDAEAASALFDEAAILFPPVGGAAVRGRAGVRAALAAFYGAMEVLDERYREVKIESAGDVGYTSWLFTLKLRPRGQQGEPTTMQGRASWVLRRGGDGQWRIVVDHASLEPPSPNG